MTKPYTGRRAARVLIIQGLYAWMVSGVQMSEMERGLVSGEYAAMYCEFEDTESVPLERVDERYFGQTLHVIIENKDKIDALLIPKLDRPIDQLGPIEHAILLLGLYELKFRKDIPYRVAINEAIDLAKDFGAQESHKFINGVLDKLARDINYQAEKEAKQALQEA